MGAKRRKKRGIKRKAVLSKIMERTAQNQVIFGANAKKEKSRNPHGYWIFRWRSGWDSNPRAREDYLISSQARYDHFDTAPYMFSRRFSPPFSDRKRLWKELTERTANYSVFEPGKTRMVTRFLVDETDNSPQDFESGPKDRFDTLLYILFHLCRRTTLFRLPRYFSKNKGFCQHKD